MSAYSVLVSLHVIIAVLGLGPLTTLAVVATRPGSPPWPPERIAPLLRLVGGSLLGMFLSGCGIVALTRGALGHTRWMLVSVGLFLVLGFLHGQARRLVRRAQHDASAHVLPPSLRVIFWSMCGLVAAITYLMEAKPW